jgi:hypothetical protein
MGAEENARRHHEDIVKAELLGEITENSKGIKLKKTEEKETGRALRKINQMQHVNLFEY